MTRHRRRVLIVDDHADTAEMYAEVARILGHDARAAHNGRAALCEAAVFKPDTVMLDLSMPGLSGLDVAKALRRQDGGARLRIIAITGWVGKEREALEDGLFDVYLLKPIGIHALVETID